MNKFLLLLALATPLLAGYEIAKADEGDLWLDVNLASYHTAAHEYCDSNKCDSYNQFNYGLGLTYDIDGTMGVTGGFYQNSYNKTSIYGGMVFKHDFTYGKVAVSPTLLAGFVTGYADTEVKANFLKMMALPAVSVSYDHVRVLVGYLPMKTLGSAGTDVLTFQAGYRF